MAFLLMLLVVLSLCLAVPTLGSWQNGDDGVDRPLGDLPDMPITLENGGIPADCAVLCSNYTLDPCKGWVYYKAFCDGRIQPLCYLKANLTKKTYNLCAVSGLPSEPLILWNENRFLPVGTIVPQGWLRDQLEIQARGLSGHLPLFWPDVMNSTWVGGNADVGLHERTPYWLNGFVPLAYQLKNSALIGHVNKYIDYILTNQKEDGWLGPDDSKDGNMYWSKFPLLLALTQYHEANSTDTRVLPAILKFLKALRNRLFVIPLGDTWSGARWQDLVLSVHWMLRDHPSGEEQMLYDLAEMIHDQGFDWNSWFDEKQFPKEPVTTTSLYTHGVNNGQALKSGAVWFQQSDADADYYSSYSRVKILDKYHGQASGIFGCDEHLAGNMPSRGSELCTVVETMYSYEILFSILDQLVFSERVELLAYNALPATFTPDMWAHQYLQQSNEMNAIHADQHVWTHDGPDSTLYGLAPNYGCCTANFNQGWPKFTQYIVMEKDVGDCLVISTFAPVSLKHTMRSGQKVTLDMKTDYPFGEVVTINVTSGIRLVLEINIPFWAANSTMSVNGSKPSSRPAGNQYQPVCSWSTQVVLTFPMKVRMTRRYNNAASIYRGPVLYALHMDENIKPLRSYTFNSKDYQVTPGSAWNYALQLSEKTIEKDLVVETREVIKGISPFSNEGVPVIIRVKGRLLDSWNVTDNSADPPPPSPVVSDNPLTDLVLIPFGATLLRIAEFPVLDTSQS